MSKEEVEQIVLRTILDTQHNGLGWAAMRLGHLDRLLGVPLPTTNDPAAPYGVPDYLADAETIADAVVAAIQHHGRVATSRKVLDLIRPFPSIAQEGDERMKRRKVSQALFTQKGKRLKSMDSANGGRVWGLIEWEGDLGGRGPAQDDEVNRENN